MAVMCAEAAPHWPLALVEVTASMLRELDARHRPGEHIEIMFTPDALKALGRQNFACLATVTKFNGVPVEFPEQPSMYRDPAVIEIKVAGSGAVIVSFLPVELLLASRPVVIS